MRPARAARATRKSTMYQAAKIALAEGAAVDR
jgi:hypothetical protein